MKKIDNDIKMIITILICVFGIFTMMFTTLSEKNKYAKKISEYKKQIKYKDEIIESQAKMLIQNEYNNCYCGWFEDFYYEHSNEIGAYE